MEKMMMNDTIRSVISAALCAMSAAIVAACMGQYASAQTFQRLYGGAFREAGMHGACPVLHAPFGYIAAGMSYTPSAGVDADIYIVRTNSNGGLIWSRTFNIGGDDFAKDIIECANGDFVITGFTHNRNNCCDTDQIFLMRIDNSGNLMWDRAYGGLDMEFPSAVIESKINDPVTGRGSGDLIVVGITNSFGSGFTHNAPDYVPPISFNLLPNSGGDAYMMRTDSSGAVKWGRTYGDAIKYLTMELFNSVAEITQGPNAGDLVAVGYSTGFRCACLDGPHYYSIDQTRGFIVRTDRNGSIDPVSKPSTFSKIYTRASSESTNNVVFNSVSECITVPNAGGALFPGEYNFVVAGESSGRPYVIYLDPRGSALAQATYAPSNMSGTATCIREISYGAPYTTGDFVVCGQIVGQVPAGLGAQDAFAFELRPPALGFVLPVWAKLYGGAANDYATTIAPVPSPGAWGAGGFIIDGATLSFTNPNEQLYLIKTNIVGLSGCNEMDMIDEMNVPGNYDSVVSTYNSRFRVQCNGGAGYTTAPAGSAQLCFSQFGKANEGDNRIETDGDKGEPADAATELALDYYPNPIKRGEVLHVRYKVGAAAEVSISITDLLGKEFSLLDRSAMAGENDVAIETAWWPVGSYLIKLRVGNSTLVRKVIVTNR